LENIDVTTLNCTIHSRSTALEENIAWKATSLEENKIRAALHKKHTMDVTRES